MRAQPVGDVKRVWMEEEAAVAGQSLGEAQAMGRAHPGGGDQDLLVGKYGGRYGHAPPYASGLVVIC